MLKDSAVKLISLPGFILESKKYSQGSRPPIVWEWLNKPHTFSADRQGSKIYQHFGFVALVHPKTLKLAALSSKK